MVILGRAAQAVQNKQAKPRATRKVQIGEIPKKVLVRVYRENMLLEAFAKFDGKMVTCKKLGISFIPDPSVKPTLTYFKGKPYVTFDITDTGKPLQIKVDKETLKVNPKDVDAQYIQNVVSSNIFAQLFRRLRGIDMGSLFFGLGVGMFLIILVLFFILPIMGIPVSVGQRPITVNVPSTSPSLPPTGNFTITFP